MADRTVLSPLTDVEWLRSLGARLWFPRMYRTYYVRNGYHDRTRRLTRTEFDRIKHVVRNHGLPCEVLHTQYGTELAIYVVERDVRKEVMRLTHWHIPSHSANPRFRRRVAIRTFTAFVEELERERTRAPEHVTSN